MYFYQLFQKIRYKICIIIVFFNKSEKIYAFLSDFLIKPDKNTYKKQYKLKKNDKYLLVLSLKCSVIYFNLFKKSDNRRRFCKF